MSKCNRQFLKKIYWLLLLFQFKISLIIIKIHRRNESVLRIWIRLLRKMYMDPNPESLVSNSALSTQDSIRTKPNLKFGSGKKNPGRYYYWILFQDTAASGGYWLACTGKQIFAARYTFLNRIF